MKMKREHWPIVVVVVLVIILAPFWNGWTYEDDLNVADSVMLTLTFKDGSVENLLFDPSQVKAYIEERAKSRLYPLALVTQVTPVRVYFAEGDGNYYSFDFSFPEQIWPEP